MDYDAIVGIDISKASFHVAVKIKDTSARFIKEFDNDKQGFKAFHQWLKASSYTFPLVCMESTGCYSAGLAKFLAKKASITVCVANPRCVKHFGQARLARNKTDKADAKVIAEYASVMPQRAYTPPTKLAQTLKELTQLLHSLKGQKVQYKNQLHAYGSSEARKFLTKQVHKLSRSITSLQAKLEQLLMADDLLACQFEKLITIPGIGKDSAIALLSLMPDVSLFTEGKQYAAYAGVTPAQRSSGQYMGVTRLSKQGDPLFRKAIYMPALTAKNRCACYQKFVKRLEEKGLAKKAIVGAMMRKLLMIVYAVLKSDKPFDMEYYLNQVR